MKTLKNKYFALELFPKKINLIDSQLDMFSEQERELIQGIEDQLHELKMNQSKLRFMSKEIQKVIRKIK